jgi:hypothetical protein
MGVTIQEHAEDTRAGEPPQLEANEGIMVADVAM